MILLCGFYMAHNVIFFFDSFIFGQHHQTDVIYISVSQLFLSRGTFVALEKANVTPPNKSERLIVWPLDVALSLNFSRTWNFLQHTLRFLIAHWLGKTDLHDMIDPSLLANDPSELSSFSAEFYKTFSSALG